MSEHENPAIVPLQMRYEVPILDKDASFTTYGITMECVDGTIHHSKVAIYGDEKLAERIFSLLTRYGMEDTP